MQGIIPVVLPVATFSAASNASTADGFNISAREQQERRAEGLYKWLNASGFFLLLSSFLISHIQHRIRYRTVFKSEMSHPTQAFH